jgi:cell division protein FtsI/penicillin-binding protein 2
VKLQLVHEVKSGIGISGRGFSRYAFCSCTGFNPESLLSSTSISGFEKIHDVTLRGHDGGSIVMKDSNGKTLETVHTRDSRNGQSISVSN